MLATMSVTLVTPRDRNISRPNSAIASAVAATPKSAAGSQCELEPSPAVKIDRGTHGQRGTVEQAAGFQSSGVEGADMHAGVDDGPVRDGSVKVSAG